MNNSKLLGSALRNSIGVLVYCGFVAWLMFNAERFLSNGKPDTFLAPLTFLLLFVISATIVGGLVLGQPIYLYLEKSKTEAIKLFFYTVASLAILTLLVFVAVALFSK